MSYESDQLVESLAQTYALTGASIANILKKACLRLHAKGETSLTLELLKPLIQEEYIKEQRNPNIPDRWPEHFYNRN